MSNWLIEGLIGGLFGKQISVFLSRYKLRFIFTSGAIGLEIFIFFSMVRARGWEFAWHRMLQLALTPTGILAPLIMGTICVTTIALCAPGSIGKSKESSKDNCRRRDRTKQP